MTTDYQRPLRVDGEVSGPGIHVLAGRRVLDDEEAASFDRHIERIVRRRERPLAELGLDALHPRTETDGDPFRRVVALGVLRTGELDLAIEQVFEVRPPLFEGGGIHVRQIIGDDVELGFHRLHSGRGGVQRLYAHSMTLERLRSGSCDAQVA